MCYANRPQGATTGAWPGYQPFGGWKGSGATGKSAGSLYHLPQYMREQAQTRVRRVFIPAQAGSHWLCGIETATTLGPATRERQCGRSAS